MESNREMKVQPNFNPKKLIHFSTFQCGDAVSTSLKKAKIFVLIRVNRSLRILLSAIYIAQYFGNCFTIIYEVFPFLNVKKILLYDLIFLDFIPKFLYRTSGVHKNSVVSFFSEYFMNCGLF